MNKPTAMQMTGLSTIVLILSALAPLMAVAATTAVAFVGVNVVPMDAERVLSDQTVLIEGGRIIALGKRSELTIPRRMMRVDGEGRYLVPGLADMHTHFSGYPEAGGNERHAGLSLELLSYVATGITTVRNMSGSDAHLESRRRVAAGELLGPRIFTTTNIVDGPQAIWPTAIKLTDPAAAGSLVDGFARDGYDQIKIYNALSLEAYAALSDAAARAGMKIAGHVPFTVGISGALASGQYSIEHLRGYDFDGVRPQALVLEGGRNAERFGSWQHMSEERMHDLVRRTVASGTWNCPTFVIDDMMSNPAGRSAVAQHELIGLVPTRVSAALRENKLDALFSPDANRALRASFPQRYKFVKMLSDAGAGLLVGTDSMIPYLVPGYTTIDEMQHFVRAGLSPYQALRAGTSEAARFLGVTADSGTIAVGKRADLILVDVNPLEDIAGLWQLSGVAVNGRWLPRSELRKMLERMAVPAAKSSATGVTR